MQSEFIALQCPCGCELSAQNRLERLYRALLFIFDDTEIMGNVSCMQGVNSQLVVKTRQHPDSVQKHVNSLLRSMDFKFSVLSRTDGTWLFDVNKKDGLSYEPI